ncbi:hypothetical protein EB75_08220 [Mycobacterium sp. ST-F2]|uniref:hypothetical protein n=1 Tax=Mycobacterium sp. ST-F2 TaxID=1490484 RepID=UPI0009392A62|nr:hypothetical protein [Mycobacterium sp. ST-F2]OKH83558.1 hypothetical protein EB75_08220 [Mycobacterium sp. ST-F2]
MPGFVIEFNRQTGERRVTEFATAREAMERRLALEAERTDQGVEIVALISDSLKTLRQTHSRYFTGEELAAI